MTGTDGEAPLPPRAAPLWSGRLDGSVHELFSLFNDSLPIDGRLLAEDLDASAAWARALERAGVLGHADRLALEEAIEAIREAVAADPSRLQAARDEDVHSFVERELVARLGDLGKRLHTGRSRNDQVATDLRLWTMRAIDARSRELQEAIHALVALADREREAVFPGYTHLQRAQPILFAHWCLAYVEMLRRDLARLADARRRTASCPLGSAALAGTAYPIDRESLAVDLGFAAASVNSLDAVGDRDFVAEAVGAISLCAVHLSRLAEDLIFYASSEAGLVELPDGLCSGSSIMPQKRNPDALELMRGKAAIQIGRGAGVLALLKGLPTAYNKDLQEDKATLFASMDDLSICLRVLPPLLDGLRVRRDRAREAAIGDFANATELADHLARHGVPFRDAHHQAGRLVNEAIARGVGLEGLPLETIRGVAPAATGRVFVDLTIESALARRRSVGGTAPDQVAARLARLRRPPARSAGSGEATVRTATVEDLPGIKRLVDLWADAGENLPRSEEEILHSIRDFAVALDGGEVVGCGALWLYTPTLGEIRSVGVDPDRHGGGIGSRIVEHLAGIAAKLRVERVFVLTRAPLFFERLGFRQVSVNALPEKILKDCARCPKRHCCDEIAMVRTTFEGEGA